MNKLTCGFCGHDLAGTAVDDHVKQVESDHQALTDQFSEVLLKQVDLESAVRSKNLLIADLTDKVANPPEDPKLKALTDELEALRKLCPPSDLQTPSFSKPSF